MRCMRLVQIMTGAPTGSVPPESPVPAPRGTKAMPSLGEQPERPRPPRPGVARQDDELGRRALERVAVALVDERAPRDDR